jgi:hypothetical protein
MGLTINEAVLVRAVFHGQVDAGEIRRWLAGVERLIVARTPFFFIAATLPGASFCDDYRAIQAVWYKQHKAAFRRYCRGLVRITVSAEDQQRLDTPALHAAWGVPYFVTTDEHAGLQWITTQWEAGDAR